MKVREYFILRFEANGMKLKTSDMAICAETSAFSIREYSNQGLLGPVPREENNNYRSFDPRLIPLIYLLRTLRELGFSSQQFAQFGSGRSPEQARDILRRYGDQLEIELGHMQASLDMLRGYLSLIEEGIGAAPGEIGLRTLGARPLRYSSLVSFSSRTGEKERLRRAAGQIRQNGNAGCPMGFAYRAFDDFLERPEQPAQLVSFDPQGPDTRPAGEYLVGTAAAFYGETGSLPARMLEYAQGNGLELAGPAYTVYLHDAACVTDPGRYLLQAAAAVEQAN